MARKKLTLSTKANYGNWVPANIMKMLGAADSVLAVLTFLFQRVFQLKPAAWVTGILCLIFCAYTFYMWRCREAFDFKKGDIMGDVHQFLVDHLKWDGKGTFLDIGCGAGALTMRCAKTFPKASFVGMDYWGKEWSYAKEQCEQNAKLEGVAARGRFEKGDAAKLAFPDETFDAVVSNFVFHEVRTAKDKRDVVREALRVLKKGGAFSLQGHVCPESAVRRYGRPGERAESGRFRRSPLHRQYREPEPARSEIHPDPVDDQRRGSFVWGEIGAALGIFTSVETVRFVQNCL